LSSPSPAQWQIGYVEGVGRLIKIAPLFNAAPATFLLNLAGSVVNYGLLNNAICEATPDQQARLLRLSFNHALEPSEQHAVIWWDVNGQLISLAPKAWTKRTVRGGGSVKCLKRVPARSPSRWPIKECVRGRIGKIVFGLHHWPS
jgi:hypothetical protein